MFRNVKRDYTIWKKIKYKYWSIVSPKWRPCEIWYGLKCAVWHKYTTVKPRTLKHNTWTDRTELLPHLMFEVLTQFIEEECSPGNVEWYGEYGHKITIDGKKIYVMDEMLDLYYWWNEIDFGGKTLYDTELNTKHKEIWDRINEISDPTFDPTDNGCYELNSNVAEENEIEYSNLRKEDMANEYKDQKILTKNMCRLCNLQPYLWT